MPVYKFRDVAAMNQPKWRTPGDPQLYTSIAALWERAARLSPRRFTPGVRKFRNIGDLEAAADAIRSDPTGA